MGQETQIAEHHLRFTAPDGTRVPAFLAEPREVKDAPRVLIAPEFYGLTPWIEETARRLAREEIRTIAVELFARDPLPAGADVQALRSRAQRLDRARALEDLRAGFGELGHGGKAGVIGFCMGGTYALLLAAEGGFQAAVSCYGNLRTGALEVVSKIRCPVLGIYGKKDASIPAADAVELEKRLPKGSEVALYDAGHAFLNDTRPDMYVDNQATLAWAKIEGFFARELWD